MLTDKELTKSLLRGPKCTDCYNKLTHLRGSPQHYCAARVEKPSYRNQCTCKEYVKFTEEMKNNMTGLTTTSWNLASTIKPSSNFTSQQVGASIIWGGTK